MHSPFVFLGLTMAFLVQATPEPQGGQTQVEDGDNEDDFFNSNANLSEVISNLVASTLSEFKRNPSDVVRELVKVLDDGDRPEEQARQYGSQLFADLFSLSSKIMAMHKAVQHNDMIGLAKVILKETPFYVETEPRAELADEAGAKYAMLTNTIHRILSFLVPSISMEEVSTCLGLFEKIVTQYYNSYNKSNPETKSDSEVNHEEL